MKQCNYIVSYVNGNAVFTSKKSGRVITGTAKLACERAEAERETERARQNAEEFAETCAKWAEMEEEAREYNALDEAIDNALTLCWYEENADLIDAEQKATQAKFSNRTAGAGFIVVEKSPVIIWPSAFGQGLTRAQAHAWLQEIRAKRHAERIANTKRSHNSAHKQATSRAVDYVARRILGGKAMREGKRVHVVFTRRVITLRSLSWRGLAPRVYKKVGCVKDGDTFRAWILIKTIINGKSLAFWFIGRIARNLWPVVKVIKRGGDDGPKGSPIARENETIPATGKIIPITGWAFNKAMLRRLEGAFTDEEVRSYLAGTFAIVTKKFVQIGLNAMGWRYNAYRYERNAVMKFLNRRDTETGQTSTHSEVKYDVCSVSVAMMTICRCMLHAMKTNPGAVVATRETRPLLARLCKIALRILQTAEKPLL